MHEEVLYIDRVLWPVTALGPGERIAVWVSGCSRGCPGCANPELWKRRPEQAVPVKKFIMILKNLCQEKHPEGLTITGGEPFDQAEGLAEVLKEMDGHLSDILIYSGYRIEELQKDPARRELLSRVDVLIDGPYVDEQNKPSIVLRGSENQRICWQNPAIREKYEPYLKLGRQIQNFVYDYRILSVGIHSPERKNV